jgi:hypothetical protein
MPFDVFISYSSKDKSTADAVCNVLETAKVRCWIAPRDISPGTPDWPTAIIEAIDHCRAMVLIFSESANSSHDVQREVHRAFSRNCPVIPLRVQDTTPTDSLAYYLERVHWLDALTPPLETHLQRLTEAVRALLQVPISDAPSNGEKNDAAQAPRVAMPSAARWVPPFYGWPSVRASAKVLVFIIIAIAVTSGALAVSSISPPYPPAIIPLTIGIALITAIATAIFPHKASPRSMIAHAAMFAGFSALYLIDASLVIYQSPANHARFVKGWACLPDIATMYTNCPFLTLEQLSNFQYSSEDVWFVQSIALSEITLVALWVGVFVSLTLMINTACARQIILRSWGAKLEHG